MSIAGNNIIDLIMERGSDLNTSDYEKIQTMLVDIPLEDSDEVGTIYSAIALIVNDPLYSGDIEIVEAD